MNLEMNLDTLQRAKAPEKFSSFFCKRAEVASGRKIFFLGAVINKEWKEFFGCPGLLSMKFGSLTFIFS